MRSAILHLAFDGLGASQALSGAWHDNLSSQRVSHKLGYVENGIDVHMRRDKPDRHVGLRLSREAWLPSRRGDIELIGLGSCLELFGAVPSSRDG